MTIHEILGLILDVHKKYNTSEPFIVGGLPRDKLLNRAEEVQDIDLTTGDETVQILSKAFYENMKAQGKDAHIKTFPDGHSQVAVDGMKVDFSSNFNSPQAKPLLEKAGIKVTPMVSELISRDFTCNTLLMKLDLSTINDPTGMAVKDIEAKMIRTPIQPKYTLENDPKRIVRIIYLATKLGFDVEPDVINFVASNPGLIKSVKEKYIQDKINQSFNQDARKTSQLLDQMNLWEYIPNDEI